MTVSAQEGVNPCHRAAFEPVREAADHVRLSSSGASNRPRILLVSKYFKLAYRVLRCAKAAGCDVFVLSAPQGVGLSTSRLCDGYYASRRDIQGQFDPGLAHEINLWVKRLQIDMVLPGDAPSTRCLIAIRRLIEAPCFPMPTLEVFDLLNDKWRFGALCERLRIKRPDTILLHSADQLFDEIGRNIIFPKMVKPLNLDNSIGCVALRDKNDLDKLRQIDYNPLIVQDYIYGRDIGASVFCLNGDIKAFVAHCYQRNSYKTFFNRSIFDDISAICVHLKLNGVYNFDMRLDKQGDIYFLECNPRFFFKIAMSMLAGVNFVALGLPGCELTDTQKVCAPAVVQFPKALLAALPTPWRLRPKSWDALKYVASDPVPYLREEFGLEADALKQTKRWMSGVSS